MKIRMVVAVVVAFAAMALSCGSSSGTTCPCQSCLTCRDTTGDTAGDTGNEQDGIVGVDARNDSTPGDVVTVDHGADSSLQDGTPGDSGNDSGIGTDAAEDIGGRDTDQDAAHDAVVDTGSDEGSDIPAQPFYKLVQPTEAEALIAEFAGDPTFHIIDVRTESEFASGHIAGAVNINVFGDFSAEIGKLPVHDVYLVYCASQHRSPGAVATMQELGFLIINELAGGLGAWSDAGLPVTKN